MEKSQEHDSRARSRAVILIENFSEGLMRWMSVNVRIILHEIDLFIGTVLLTIGLFSFESDKYCDGNTSEYLACTRPSTFYYFSSLDILFITVGLFFILIWFLKDRADRR